MQQRLFILFLVAVAGISQCSQSNSKPGESLQEKIGGRCEDCEAIYESPVSFEKLPDFTSLPDMNDQGTRLEINGVVYKKDGKTPAPGVVIYVYHTDQTGVYPTRGNEKGWAKRHGYIRGWMRTNDKGEYKFVTLKPAPYPGGGNPSHIHITIKEPNKNEYWIDEYLFGDDPILTEAERKHCQNRGGSGIIKTTDVGNMLKARRDIYLGKNIPNYP